MQKTQIALFPLQMLLLPGETTRLHIFEERYRQLLDDCEKPGVVFGIPYAIDGMISGFGCVVEVSKVLKRHHNGAADIEINCTEIFRLSQFYLRMGEKLYPGGDVVVLADEDMPRASEALLSALDGYIKLTAPEKFTEILSPLLNILQVGRLLSLDDEEKLKLISARSEVKQERVLLNKIKLMTALRMQVASIEGNVFLN